MNNTIAIIGAGRIANAAEVMLRAEGMKAICFDEGQYTDEIWDEYDIFLALCPWQVSMKVIHELKKRDGKWYFDCTEDVKVGQAARKAGAGRSIFVPHCGVAPGAVSIIGANLLKHAARTTSLHIRVGALPQRPVGRLGYALNWSTVGLINEYIKPCPAIRSGNRVDLTPLADLDSWDDGDGLFESFNTSGGAGTLTDTMVGKVFDLDYKTIRYAGHNHLMRFLMEDLGGAASPDIMATLLDRALPSNVPDLVKILIWAVGCKGWEYDRVIYPAGDLSAIQRTTAAGVVSVMLACLQWRREEDAMPIRNGTWIANEDIPIEWVARFATWRDVYGEPE